MAALRVDGFEAQEAGSPEWAIEDERLINSRLGASHRLTAAAPLEAIPETAQRSDQPVGGVYVTSLSPSVPPSKSCCGVFAHRPRPTVFPG